MVLINAKTPLLQKLDVVILGQRLFAMENSGGFSYNICSKFHRLSGSGSLYYRVLDI